MKRIGAPAAIFSFTQTLIIPLKEKSIVKRYLVGMNLRKDTTSEAVFEEGNHPMSSKVGTLDEARVIRDFVRVERCLVAEFDLVNSLPLLP
uniref:SFRICE_025381 n=1 Tax=Spodoptera frugiperda TaxID=7108 RepID=A0A2H1V969_SPOFR